ncbi:ACT domain-containing protein [Runella aurantiaca]|uniref:ACT domain-containing protein n=2 Tax=Runella aurantiaca TaxID=2282308 RepID=A0A369IDC3_9BACT|nr:ACT domain-containing protein [Runella aurantiaca]
MAKNTGETDIPLLLKGMNPILNSGEYVFCTLEKDAQIHVDDVLFFFREAEGNTVVIRRDQADAAEYAYMTTFAWISLTIHSSLEATGLTAAFSSALAQHRISCNVVAAYYHDHIFVPVKDAEKAMGVLKAFSE